MERVTYFPQPLFVQMKRETRNESVQSTCRLRFAYNLYKCFVVVTFSPFFTSDVKISSTILFPCILARHMALAFEEFHFLSCTFLPTAKREKYFFISQQKDPLRKVFQIQQQVHSYRGVLIGNINGIFLLYLSEVRGDSKRRLT